MLDFETSLSDVATKYDGFRIVKADTYDGNRISGNGSLGLKVVSSAASIFYIDVDAEKLNEMGMFSISFDMTLLNDGKSGKEGREAHLCKDAGMLLARDIHRAVYPRTRHSL